MERIRPGFFRCSNVVVWIRVRQERLKKEMEEPLGFDLNPRLVGSQRIFQLRT